MARPKKTPTVAVSPLAKSILDALTGLRKDIAAIQVPDFRQAGSQLKNACDTATPLLSKVATASPAPPPAEEILHDLTSRLLNLRAKAEALRQRITVGNMPQEGCETKQGITESYGHVKDELFHAHRSASSIENDLDAIAAYLFA